MLDGVCTLNAYRDSHEQTVRERRDWLMESFREELLSNVVEVRHGQARLVLDELTRGFVGDARSLRRCRPRDFHGNRFAFESPTVELEGVGCGNRQSTGDRLRTIPC